MAGEKAINRRHRSSSSARTACALLAFGFVALIVRPAPATHDPTQGHHTFTGPIGLAWQALTDANAPFADLVAMAVAPGGTTVFVTGTSDLNGTGRDFLTLALDVGTGSVLWSARFDAGAGNPDLADAPRGIAVSPDGSTVFVTGDSELPFGLSSTVDYLTVAYDTATGAELWTARYDGFSDTSAHLMDTTTGVLVTPDGQRVIATGRTGSHIGTVSYDAATGAQQWLTVENVDGDERPLDLAVAPDGATVFVVGQTGAVGVGGAFRTYAYATATGVQAWAAFFDGTGGGNDIAEGVAVSPDSSRVFVTGTTLATGGHINYATIAYDSATGAQLWAKESPDGSAHDVAASPDGSQVFVTGEKTVLRTYYDQDWGTVAYNAATGAEQWSMTYNGPGNRNDRATLVATRSSGSQVLVSGVSGPVDNDDFVTIAYDAATGAQQWIAESDGAVSSPDAPFGVADAAARVIVAGRIEGAGPSFDMMTVAYCSVRFADTPCTHWAFAFIDALVAAGIAAGYPDGDFHPEVQVTRAQSAVLLARAVDSIDHDFDAFSPPACGHETFKDVRCTYWAYPFIEYLAAKGLAVGTSVGAFSPEALLPRTQMAVSLARLRDRLDGDFAAFTPPACGSESFPDVPCTRPDYKAIEYIKTKGIASGFGDGTFRPLALVTRAQMAVFLVRAAELPL